MRMVEYLSIPVLMKNLHTSDELVVSAPLRGLGHINEQTILYSLELKTFDYIIEVVSILIVIVLFYLQFK